MPVRISVKDGPASALWMSASIVPGTGNFSPVQEFYPAADIVDYGLVAGTDYSFKIRVDNLGTEDVAPNETEGLVGPPPWPFVIPTGPVKTPALAGPGNTQFVISPSTNSRTEIKTVATGLEIRLVSLAGVGAPRDLLPAPGFITVTPNMAVGGAPPDQFDFGYSPNGKYWVICYKNPTAGSPKYLGKVYAADDVLAGVQTAGTLVQTYAIEAPDAGVFSFMPGSRDLIAFWDAGNAQRGLQSTNLRPNAPSPRFSNTIFRSQAVARRLLASPTGDFLAVIPDAGWGVFVHALPGLTGLVPTSKGIATSLPAGPMVTIDQILPSGFDAIRVSGLSDPMRPTQTIDTPVSAYAAVEVYLWVDLSSTVFDYKTAAQLPGSKHNQYPPVPSAFIDRIPAMGFADAVVFAGWTAAAPPANQHYCAIAEAYTAAGINPASVRSRTTDTFNVVANEQIGQRNLTVI